MVVVECGRGGVVDGESESRGKVSSSEADMLLSFDQASVVRSVMNLYSLDDGSMKRWIDEIWSIGCVLLYYFSLSFWKNWMMAMGWVDGFKFASQQGFADSTRVKMLTKLILLALHVNEIAQ